MARTVKREKHFGAWPSPGLLQASFIWKKNRRWKAGVLFLGAMAPKKKAVSSTAVANGLDTEQERQLKQLQKAQLDYILTSME